MGVRVCLQLALSSNFEQLHSGGNFSIASGSNGYLQLVAWTHQACQPVTGRLAAKSSRFLKHPQGLLLAVSRPLRALHFSHTT